MFPTIFALSIKGLGQDTKIGASLVVMAIIGGAVFTPLMGYLAIRSMALAMVVPLFCYVYITYFAFWGSGTKGPVTEESSFVAPSH
ncbi:MAG: sugar MFS transporter [Bacteroidetes bacterium]|nr:sugar MFS transporter [Bacteroidota bacterium]